jgi:hypothetical protein
MLPFWRGYYLDNDPEDPDSVNPITHKLNIHNIEHAGEELTGSGSHPQFGPFQIEGTSQGANVNFKLKFNDKVLLCEGKKEDNCIAGEWGTDPDENINNFKFEYIVPKHGWNGRYVQYETEHEMYFDNF